MAKHLVLRPFRLGPKGGLENEGEIVKVKEGDVVECKSFKDSRGEWKGDSVNGVEMGVGFIRRMITARKLSAEVVENKPAAAPEKKSKGAS
mgnify:CR=1 FL=1